MTDRTVTTRIDESLCIGCGACVDVCPSDTIELLGETASVTGTESLNCGHCEAMCPEGAITVGSQDPEAARYSTFTAEKAWLPYGASDTAELVRLMASRRSCRNYTDETVDRDALVDLAKIGATAPSGTNSQGWRFAIVPDRSGMLAFGEGLATFFRTLNWVADRSAVRLLTRIVGKPELAEYHHDHQPRVEEALSEWERGTRERLFHGATAAIVVSTMPGTACPKEDALLASQNILLAAHTMGFGTCLIGYAVEAIRNDPRIKRHLGLARGEEVHAVIALGHPDETWERVGGRKAIPIRFVTE